MKKRLKKGTALLLICCMALSICSAGAFAAGAGEFDPVGNLLPNPGMEEGSDSQAEWSYDENTMFLCISNGDLPIIVPHAGDYAIGYIQNNANDPTLVYQDVQIPDSGIYEFSGYFATAADMVTIQVGAQSISFPGNGRVWEKQSLLFYADAGESIRIEITSTASNMVGFWMDDVCLSLCEGSSFEDDEAGWILSGGELLQEPALAMQGTSCVLLSGEMMLDGPTLEPGDYILSFFVRNTLDEAMPCEIYTELPMNGDFHVTDPFELANQWKNITVPFTLEHASDIVILIGSPVLSEVLVDNVSFVKMADLPPAPPVEQLANCGFENGLSGWTRQQGSPAASILNTTSQAHSGDRSLFMGYFSTEAMNNCISQDSSAGAGQYLFSAYIKTEANLTGVGAVLLLEAKDANGNVLAASASPAVSNSNGDWTTANVTLNAPTGTITVTAKIGGLYCQGGFFVDDVSLLYSA